MNWKEIAETCPKAWKEFGESKTCVTGWKNRDLYDHFDALGIVVEVYREVIVQSVDEWSWAFKVSPLRTDGNNIFHNNFKSTVTRTEAEAAAFTRALALREGQLNKQQ